MLALHYDGTVALDGVLDPAVRSAIGEARSRGIVVLIGVRAEAFRPEDLVRDIGCVDAVVAENGAVIAFPNGQARQLAAPPPAQFLRELAQQGIPFSVGQCVVEADATWAHQILERHSTPQIFLPRRRDCIHADQCYDRD